MDINQRLDEMWRGDYDSGDAIVALRAIVAMHHPERVHCADRFCDDFPHSWMECSGCDNATAENDGRCEVYRAIEAAFSAPQ